MRRRLLSIFILLLLLVIQTTNAFAQVSVSSQSTVIITATVGSTTNNGGGGGTGGSGGGGGGGIITPTTVNFSGMGYPLSNIVILKDGQTIVQTIAGPDAKFSASVTNLTTGTYTFSIYTEDKEGRHSVTFSFPLYITTGTTVNVSGIILAPTIDTDKIQVRKGDNISIFGYGVPNSEITITVNSDGEHVAKATTDFSGAYLYNFDTSPLEYGGHTATSRAILEKLVSTTSDPVGFSVGTYSVAKGKTTACSKLRGDLNCDGHVNLVDFSIMSYWYKRSFPPSNVDLNGDGKITLVDFSILAYNWTG